MQLLSQQNLLTADGRKTNLNIFSVSLNKDMLANYISSLFDFSDIAVIPGLGTFTRKNSDTDELLFDPNKSENDGMLGKLISVENDISISEAFKIIDREVARIMELTTKGEKVEFGHYGYFEQTNGVIDFVNTAGDGFYFQQSSRLSKAGPRSKGQEIQEEIQLPALIQQESRIARYTSDNIDGDDYLNISDDVEAFAKVIAARNFTPPLAIALFGHWGMGKSFFMRKLEQRIDQISEDLGDDTYCHGIVHIQFNAWSYLDSNLWASFITEIFDGLNRYLENPENLEIEEKKKLEEELKGKLDVLQEEEQAVLEKKRILGESIDSINGRRETLEEKIATEIESIKSQTRNQIIASVNKTFKVEAEVDKVIGNIEGIDQILPVQMRSNPEFALSELKKTSAFVREMFRDKRFRTNLIVGTLVGILAISLPVVLNGFGINIQMELWTIPQIGMSLVSLGIPVWLGFSRVFDKLKPILTELSKVQKSYEEKIQDALIQHEREVEASRLKVEQHQHEIASCDRQLLQLEREMVQLDFELKQGLSTRALHNFIEKRASSNDYKQHLGIISTIRKDFKTLSTLFTESIEEQTNSGSNVQFKDKRKLQRIVLYIDDLDRCPEDRVIEVLEAVNLLTTFPLFVVVVGVDPRWVKNALKVKYDTQFKFRDDYGRVTLEPSDYLEKIFQVPFHLKTAKQSDVSYMMTQLVKLEPMQTRSEDEENGQRSVQTVEKNLGEVNAGEKSSKVKKPENDSAVVEPYVALSSRELELMQALSGVVGTNPRAIKRYVNVYQIVRAHAGLSVSSSNSEEAYLGILFLLALPLGPFKSRYVQLIDFLESPKRNQNDSLEMLFDEIDAVSLGRSAEQFFQYEELRNLKNAIQPEVQSVLLKLEAGVLRDQNAFIRRFTFADVG